MYAQAHNAKPRRSRAHVATRTACVEGMRKSCPIKSWFEDGVLNVSANCIDRHLAKRGDQSRSSGKATTRPIQEHHLSRAARRGLPLRQCAEGAGRQEGRPRHHLPADDPRGGLRHAGLRPHRRGPFGGVRRLLAGFSSPAASRTANSKVVITADEGLRGGKNVPLKPTSTRPRQGRRRRERDRGQAHRRQRADGPGRDVWYHEAGRAKVDADCPPSR
jgi:acetyl-CoA synthetase